MTSLRHAVDSLVLPLSSREEIGGEDAIDVVPHHVAIIINVRDLRKLRSELRAQSLLGGHKIPFHGRLVQVARDRCVG